MPRFSVQKILPYTQQQLFALVADIEAYPDFVLGLTKTNVEVLAPHLLRAHVEFGNRFYHDSYVCQVALTPFEKIEVQGLSGPFTAMHSKWRFNPQADSSKTQLDFTVHFTFKNKILQYVAEPLFTKMTHHMVQAFEERAIRIYSST